ncbi:hypothetical protein Scep_020587 [Stephania cephalantha]|uniref:AAA+ ATPase domain-containing protein n=1 Tax=Stephania cephalantha TaxID=152367 RepID=A0AAP0ICY8_9MAGN
MFSLSNMPSTSTVLSAYTSFAASAMLVRSMASEVRSIVEQFIPDHLQTKLLSVFGLLYSANRSSQLTLVVNEHDGYTFNQMFEGAEIFLRTKITPSVERLRVSKFSKDKNLSVSVDRNQVIVDEFRGVELRWRLVTAEREEGREERKYFELSFHRKHKELVLGTYLPCVLERSKTIKEENKAMKLYSLGFCGDDDGGGVWGSINLDHPATFDTLAMDENAKRELMEDLDRFVKRKDFYRRVGKAWKRGYLLYGPPGTGKSTLIAAMANYLNFNIYDLELASVQGNSDLRNLLVATATRSIIVIEDIDCSVELHDRGAATTAGNKEGDGRLTLSGMLNFMDGLWSSCGDERIIVFTTNHKDKLDPALLRPGRMDMHIHMSYCTPDGFRLLVSNYLGIKNHQLMGEIEGLMKNVNVTPAEVAEELMKSDDAEVALNGLVEFLKRKATDEPHYNSNVEAGVLVQQMECNKKKKKKKNKKKK